MRLGTLASSHQQLVAECVYLESIDFTHISGGCRQHISSMLFQLHPPMWYITLAKAGFLFTVFSISAALRREVTAKKGKRNEELEGCSVIRRAESGSDQSGQVSPDYPSRRWSWCRVRVRFCVESVRTFRIVLALLSLECFQYVCNSLQPFVGEDAGIPRCFPVMGSQTDGITQGVDFPFAVREVPVSCPWVTLSIRSPSEFI